MFKNRQSIFAKFNFVVFIQQRLQFLQITVLGTSRERTHFAQTNCLKAIVKTCFVTVIFIYKLIWYRCSLTNKCSLNMIKAFIKRSDVFQLLLTYLDCTLNVYPKMHVVNLFQEWKFAGSFL